LAFKVPWNKLKPADAIPGKMWDSIEKILKRTDEDTNFTTRFKYDLTGELGLLEPVQQIEVAKALVGNARRITRGKMDLVSTLKRFVETRWNSILTMLRSVYDNFDQIRVLHAIFNFVTGALLEGR